MTGKFMPSCLEVTRKLAQGDLEDASRFARLLVRAHLSMCRHCRRLSRQLAMIALALRQALAAKPDPAAVEAAESRILSRLK